MHFGGRLAEARASERGLNFEGGNVKCATPLPSCVANERCGGGAWVHCTLLGSVGRSEGVVARNLEFREENDSTVEAAKLRIQEQPRRGILIFPSPFCLCPKRGERPISCGIKHQFRAEWMALFFDVQIDGRRAAAPPEGPRWQRSAIS